MKKLFLTAFAVFVASIVGFIATSIFLNGYDHVRYPSSPVYEGNSQGYVFRGDYTGAQSWTVLNDFPHVTVNSAGVKTIIGRSDTDRIKINIENPNKKTIHAEALYEGDYLTLEFRPTNITFDISDIKFGITNWLEDVFTGNSDIIVTIGFPETIYDWINIHQGSGSMQINNLYSRCYDVEIGSGKCEFNRPASGDFKSDSFELDLGSGNAVFSGVESKNFNIRIGSGKFTIDRLSGNGEIDMGSGKGSIFFCDKPDVDVVNHELDMGSGNLTLYYPEDGGVILSGDIGSGKIEIDGFDHKKTLTGSSQEGLNQFAMGNAGVYLDVDLGSGTVTIKDSSTYSAPEIISEFRIISSVIASSRQNVTILSPNSEISAEIVDFAQILSPDVITDGTGEAEFEVTQTDIISGVPEAPKAPEAPDAPKAPEAPEAPNAPENPLGGTSQEAA